MTLKKAGAQNNALAWFASTKICLMLSLLLEIFFVALSVSNRWFEQMACEAICRVLCVCSLGNQTLWMFVELRHFVSVMYASPAVM